jgi:hypothetical protein
MVLGNKMKKIVCLFIYLFVNTVNAGVINDFTDGYDVANWQQSLSGGDVNLLDAPFSIIETSSNIGGGTSNTDFTIIALGNGNVMFDWLYNTTDIDGSEFDPFGWLLNGVFVQLSANDLYLTQSGTESFSVMQGDIFGFRILATDSIFGSASTKISNFSAPINIPTPSNLMFLIVGLVSLTFFRKKRVL